MQATENAARRCAIIGLLPVAMALGLCDRINFSVALAAKDFQTFFGLSDQDRGVLSSAFFWTYAALQIPGGWIVVRFGVKWPFAIVFVLWSLATAIALTDQTIHSAASVWSDGTMLHFIAKEGAHEPFASTWWIECPPPD
ncbi:MAG: MFS transporter [Bryobacteraceae bacterium]